MQDTIDDVISEADVVLEMMAKASFAQAFKRVKRGGYVVSLQRAHKEPGEQLASREGVNFRFILVHPSSEQLAEIAGLCDADQLKVSLDAVFSLQNVAQAHKLSEGGHVRGKLVLTME